MTLFSGLDAVVRVQEQRQWEEIQKIPEFLDLFARIYQYEINEKDTEAKKNSLLRQLCLDIRGIHFWSNPEEFKSYVNLMRMGMAIYSSNDSFLKHTIEHMSKKSIFDIISEYLNIGKEGVRRKYFSHCLEQAHNELKGALVPPMLIEDTFPILLRDFPTALDNIEHVVTEAQMELVVKYVDNNRSIDIKKFIPGLRSFPDVKRESETKGYKEQFDSLLNLLADSYHLHELGSQLIDSFTETCEELEAMDRLSYYTTFANKLRDMVEKNPYMTCSNFGIFLPENLLSTIKAYQKAGLEERLFEVLDYSIKLYSDNNRMPPMGDHEEIQTFFQFFEEFPSMHKKFGEEIFDIFSTFYKIFTDKIPLNVFAYSLAQFQEAGLHETYGYDKWFDYLKKGEDIVGYGRWSALCVDSIDAIKNDINLEDYLKCIKAISDYRLFLESKNLKNVIGSNTDETTKSRFIEYYGILRKVPNLPVIRCEDSWLDEVAALLNLAKPDFVDWIDSIVKLKKELENREMITSTDDDTVEAGERYRHKTDELHKNHAYINTLPTLFQNQIDVVEYFRLLPYMPEQAVRQLPLVFKNIVNASAPINEKIEFLTKLKGKEILLSYYELDSLDFEHWLSSAEAYQKHYTKRFEELTSSGQVQCNDFLKKQLSIRMISPQSRRDIATLVEIEASGEKVKRMFTQGKQYGSEKVFGLTEKLDPVKATQYLVQGLISQDSRKIDEAGNYLATEKLSLARKFIENSNTPPAKLYKIIEEYYSELSTDILTKRLRYAGHRILQKLQSIYLDSSSDVSGKAELRELVWLVDSLYQENEIFDTLTAKIQDVKLADIDGGRRLLCCAMFSADSEKQEVESIAYCLDPYIAIMHFVPSLNGPDNDPIGAVILANAYMTDSEKQVLIVDSLEAGVLFEQIPQKKAFSFAARAIAAAAKDCNAEYVFFNTKVGGDTPKRFNKYIASLNEFQEQTTNLTKISDDLKLTHKNTRYLEAFEDREKLAGPVRGYMIETKRLKALVK